MNDSLSADVQPLSDIEQRQEEVIHLLDDLNRRIEQTIREHSPGGGVADPSLESEQLDPATAP